MCPASDGSRGCGHRDAVSREVTQLQATHRAFTGSPRSVFLPPYGEVWRGDRGGQVSWGPEVTWLAGSALLPETLVCLLEQPVCNILHLSSLHASFRAPSKRPRLGGLEQQKCMLTAPEAVRNELGWGRAPSGGSGGGSFLLVSASGARGVPGLVAASLPPLPPLHVASPMYLLLSLGLPLMRTLVTGCRAPR